MIDADADLLTCIDSVYAALIDTYQLRRDLPEDIYRLLSDAFIVLAVVRAHLTVTPALIEAR